LGNNFADESCFRDLVLLDWQQMAGYFAARAAGKNPDVRKK
jgi:hypothetical protein